MIPLRIKAETTPEVGPPFVVRLRSAGEQSAHEDDAFLSDTANGRLEYRTVSGKVRLFDIAADELDGDVVLVVPGKRIAHRLIRAKSNHNSLLVTETCDQLCVMCSQPPKARHVDVFPHLERAALLAPPHASIGLTGGEPTLFKTELFGLLDRVSTARPDLRFHVLTNGQHFGADDTPALERLAPTVLWGIPLYAPTADLHDEIVKKSGAFDRLIQSFALLAHVGAKIELRTVVMTANVAILPRLARFVVQNLPFASVWALMQLENIGYGRMNWGRLFFDNSEDFDTIGRALSVAHAHGISASLYNFPLCTVPPDYRSHAVASISDWKRRYLPECTGCALRQSCGGFFEWYPERRGFSRLGLQ